VLEGTQPEVSQYLWDRLRAQHVPMLFVTDRFVLDGMPHSLHHLSEYDQELDLLNDAEDLRVFRWQGRVYAVRYVPKAVSGPARRPR
jgi:hypothetical protein